MTWGHTTGWAAATAPTPESTYAAELDAIEAWAENMADAFGALRGGGAQDAYVEGAQSAFADVIAGVAWLRQRVEVGSPRMGEELADWAMERCARALREADLARNPLEAAHANGRAVSFDRARRRFRQSPSPGLVHVPDGDRG